MEEVPPSPATSGRRRRDRRLGGNRPGLGALAKGAAVRLEQGGAAAGDGRTEGAGERVSGAAGAVQRGSPDPFWSSRSAAGKQENRQAYLSIKNDYNNRCSVRDPIIKEF